MRCYEKKQILDSVDVLFDAIDVLRNSSNSDEKKEVLTLAQQMAISIGERIESRGINIKNTITLLEEFCELVYNFANSYQEEQKYIKSYENQVLKIKACIKDEIITEKFKMVFLPYKVSMWTSMESIWKAAVKDEDCEVTVVPIPYNNIGDENNITLSYEGNDYPKNVKVVDYKDYNLEKEHPEVIIIHNPYDGCNNLTRVPERYYSRNLKKCTECLVYSPYFTFSTYNEKKSNFLFVEPGTLYSDKIIVQSQKVKEVFLKLGFNDNRLLVSGSPKADAVRNYTKENVDMPKEWEDKLIGKKVFLLNTHLNYFPNSFNQAETTGNNYAVKFHDEILGDVLDKDDVGMIWRPHPLLKSKVYSEGNKNCIEYVEKFEKLLRESKNCVIDTYGEYKYSFAYSDAMISTWSSLVNEYMITEKPVMIFQGKISEEVVKNSFINRNLNYFRFGNEAMDFKTFIDNVMNGIDEKKNERLENLKEGFANFEGGAGRAAYEKLREIFKC